LFWYFLKYELPIIFRKYFGGNQWEQLKNFYFKEKTL
jgi:hypothetical protein